LPTEWVDRDDRIAGQCAAGPVADGEEVARYLNPEIWDGQSLKTSAFEKKNLLPPTHRPIRNEAGERDGESFIRRGGRSDAELLARANAQRPMDSLGAVVGIAGQIRSIVAPDKPDVQVFFIYEDPTVDDPLHAVIRYTDDDIHRSFFNQARRALISLLNQRKL
jgi:hypothetical protein